jgi:uncharacterized membrane protein YuzA (DUF378 family)
MNNSYNIMFGSYLYILSLSVLLFGGINWFLIGSANFDIIHRVFSFITKDHANKLSRISYLIIGICTLYLIIFQQRKMFLPFLNETIMPPTIFKSQAPFFSNSKLTIDAPGGYMVVYWGANPAKKYYDNINSWREAYDGFKNTGVADVVNDKAELVFSIPVRYSVNMGFKTKLLDRHIHYRIVYPDGVMSKVYTKKLKNEIDIKLN